MTEYEMVEKLAGRMNVSLEDAKAALEQCDWDMLDAALLLEQTHGEAPRPEGEAARAYSTRQEAPQEDWETTSQTGWRDVAGKIGRGIARVVEIGSGNSFVVSRDGKEVLKLPVIALALLLLFAFYVTVPLLIVGLFARFRYSFSGPELGREDVNRAMDKAADAADEVRERVTKKGSRD